MIINVLDYGVKGDGITDDRGAIQNAIHTGFDLYFPKGEYLLSSLTNNDSILFINNNTDSKTLKFENGAKIIVDNSLNVGQDKVAVIRVISEFSDIDYVDIRGLYIDCQYNIGSISGIQTSNRNGTHIKLLNVIDYTFKNSNGNGIHTQSDYNIIKDCKMYNVGLDGSSHGIACINYSHEHLNKFALLKNIYIKNCGGYGFDISGPKDQSGILLDNHMFSASVEDFFIDTTGYGTKKAGRGFLNVDGLTVINSDNNGFFLNASDPNDVITLKNITFTNCKTYGFNLPSVIKETNIINSTITSCGGIPIKSSNGTTNIKNMVINSNLIPSSNNLIFGCNKLIVDGLVVNGISNPGQYAMKLYTVDFQLSNICFTSNDVFYNVLIYDSLDENIGSFYNLCFKDSGGSGGLFSMDTNSIVDVYNIIESDIPNNKLFNNSSRFNLVQP